jgi:hypothetical protein
MPPAAAKVKSTPPQWQKIANAMAAPPGAPAAAPKKKAPPIQALPQWRQIAAQMTKRRR